MALGGFGAAADLSFASQGDGQRFAPSEARCYACEAGSLLLREPKQETAIRSQAPSCEWDENSQISYRSHRDCVEGPLASGANPLFQAFGTNVDLGESTRTGGFFQECSLLRHRLKKGDGEVGKGDFYRQPRKTCSTSDIEEAAPEIEVPGEEEGLAEMALDALLGTADGCEIDFFIPVQEKFKISKGLACLDGGKAQVKRFQKLS
jgi:hypothetical protein